DGDTLLVAVELHEAGRLVPARLVGAAAVRVGAAPRLDAEQLRAVLGERLAHRRAGGPGAELDHADAFERQCRHHPASLAGLAIAAMSPRLTAGMWRAPRRSQITPLARRVARSACDSPSSPTKISSLCCPTSGAGRRTRAGIALYWCSGPA